MLPKKLKFSFFVLNSMLFGYLFLGFKIDASSTCDNAMNDFFKKINNEIKENKFPFATEGTITVLEKRYVNIEVKSLEGIKQDRATLTRIIAGYFKKLSFKSVVFSIAPYNKNIKDTVKIYISSVVI